MALINLQVYRAFATLPPKKTHALPLPMPALPGLGVELSHSLSPILVKLLVKNLNHFADNMACEVDQMVE